MPTAPRAPVWGIRHPGLLFFAIALGIFDGADLTSLGLAMSRVSRELHLNPAQGGIAAATGMIGLTIGAMAAGRAADLVGRRSVLAAATVMLGVFSLATSMAWNFESLVTARFLTGLGMGGVMPILLALSADAAEPRAKATAVSALMASGGAGAMLVSIVSLAPDWRYIFYFGGFGPLLLLPIVLLILPRDSRQGTHATDVRPMPFSAAMFGDGRLKGTLLIWIVAFCTTLVSYILINWLPSLLVRQGFSENQSHTAMIAYSLGGIAGNLAAGMAMDRGGIRTTYALTYIGGALCIFGLSTAALGIGGIYALALGTNFCILGAQLVTLALAPIYYPPQVQATGLGSMVAAGRLGSVVGPFMVGQLLHSGLTANQVFLALIPALAASLALALSLAALIRRSRGGRPVIATGLPSGAH